MVLHQYGFKYSFLGFFIFKSVHSMEDTKKAKKKMSSSIAFTPSSVLHMCYNRNVIISELVWSQCNLVIYCDSVKHWDSVVISYCSMNNKILTHLVSWWETPSLEGADMFMSGDGFLKNFWSWIEVQYPNNSFLKIPSSNATFHKAMDWFRNNLTVCSHPNKFIFPSTFSPKFLMAVLWELVRSLWDLV